MKILRGRDAGDGYRLHQWANDWITADGPDGRQNIIAKPLNVQLEGDELSRMRESYLAFSQQNDRRCGRFWLTYRLQDNGTFTLTPEAAGAVRAAGEQRNAGRRAMRM